MLLSICIPTYNRRNCLAHLFSRLEVEIAGISGVEICVSDNASSDSTIQLVQEWSSRGLPLRYRRSECNEGADANYLHVAAMAQGEWIWFFGSDDLPSPGSVRMTVDALIGMETGIHVVMWNRRAMSLDGVVEAGTYEDWFPAYHCGAVIGADADSWERYFRSSPVLSCAFSYLSTLMVRRSAWLSVGEPAAIFFGTAFIHSAQLFAVISRGGRLMVRKEALIWQRMGNDSFIEEGNRYRRIMLDYDGFELIGRHYLTPSLRLALWSILWRTHIYPGQVLCWGPVEEWFPRLLRWYRMGMDRQALKEVLLAAFYLFKHRIKLILKQPSNG